MQPASLTVALKVLIILSVANLLPSNPRPMPFASLPLPTSFVCGRQGREALAGRTVAGGEQPPSPRPNSISELNGLAEEPSELSDAAPCRLGGSGPGHRASAAVAKQGEPWAPSRVAGALRE